MRTLRVTAAGAPGMPGAEAPPTAGTSSSSITSASCTSRARTPRATMALVRSSAVMESPSILLSSILVFLPSAPITYSTWRWPTSAERLASRVLALALRSGKKRTSLSGSGWSIESIILSMRRTWPPVSTMMSVFCGSSGVTEPYVPTRFPSCCAIGATRAVFSGSISVTMVSSVTVAGSSPTNVGMFSRFMSASFCR